MNHKLLKVTSLTIFLLFVAFSSNLGINFYFNDKFGSVRYVLNFNVQSNFTFGEGLDGYNDSALKFKNYAPDAYDAYTTGFRYYLGYTKIYKRTL